MLFSYEFFLHFLTYNNIYKKYAPCWICFLQLFEVASDRSESRPSADSPVALLHGQLKAASLYSGVRCRPSVLLVHEDVGQECLADVSAFLKDGNSGFKKRFF